MEDKNFKKAMKKTFKALEDATQLAIQNRDIEALIAISDRWAVLADSMINSKENHLIGFVGQEKNDREKAGDKRKG